MWLFAPSMRKSAYIQCEESRPGLLRALCLTQSKIPRSHENGGPNPLTRPASADESAVAGYPLPQGGEGIFMHGGEPKDHEVSARNDISWFLGARKPAGMSDSFETASGFIGAAQSAA